MTLFEAYKESLKKLQNPDIDEIAIRILLCEINSLKSMSDFYLKKDEEIRDLRRFYSYLQRFLNGEPIQYILGKASFFNLEFNVDNRVLIPRQESEEVVEFCIKKIHEKFGNKKIALADVCSGSGIMGISLCKNINVDKAYFSDISKDAIEITKTNLIKNGIVGTIYCDDSLNSLIKNSIKVDVLISNPPYITRGEFVDKSVLDYEPELALFADDDFSVYKKIISNLPNIKKDELLCVFEIGLNAKKVLEPFIQKSFNNVEYKFIKDMNGKERILYLFLK